jgi:nitrogen fixation NifU-like protein
MYSDIFLDHFRNPRNVGELDPPALTVRIENPICGDILKLSVRFVNGVVEDTAYQVRGCAASIVAGSALTAWLVGKSRADLAGLRPSAIEQLAGGLSPESKHAAVLCCDAVKRILEVSQKP